MQISKTGKALSVFTLMMINIIAIDSLKTLPIGAEYGASLIFYYSIAAIGFFIPTALVTAELATAWPNTGGVYVWVTQAFGDKTGSLTIWLQWIYNVVWYPATLAFLAGVLADFLDPGLANSKVYTLSIILILFWGATWINCLGIRTSGQVSIIGAVIGTLVPMGIIILLGFIWMVQGHPIQVHFDRVSLWPHLTHASNLAFLVAILFGLMGMEMSAVHAGDVKNPQKDYPKSLLYSSLIILITMIGGSLAIAMVIPGDQLNLISSLVGACAVFFKAYGLNWMIPVIVFMIILSGLASVSAWVIGPTRGLWVASTEGNMPLFLSKLNKAGAPARILILQGIIVTLLCGVFFLMSSVNKSYWILMALTSQLALLFYIFMFAAVIKLRYKNPQKTGAYRIPGGKIGVWITGGLGIFTSVGAILVGFLPPANLKITHVFTYELILILGIIIFSVPPFLMKKRAKVV